MIVDANQRCVFRCYRCDKCMNYVCESSVKGVKRESKVYNLFLVDSVSYSSFLKKASFTTILLVVFVGHRPTLLVDEV
jgi:hypothetical protein